MEELASAIGAAIGAMPPILAAVVIMSASVAMLVYFWRRAGDEAKRERQAATSGVEGQLKRLGDGQDELAESLQEVRDGVLLLLDRGKR